MNKLLLSFALLLMTALDVQAQSLEGKWVTQIEEKGQKADFYLTFDKKEVEMKIVLNAKQDEFKMRLSINMEGTYTLKDNILNNKIDSKKTKIKIEELEAKGEMGDQLKENPEMKELIVKMLQKELEKNSDELVKNIPTGGKLTILSNDGETLVIIGSDNTVMTFKRVESDKKVYGISISTSASVKANAKGVCSVTIRVINNTGSSNTFKISLSTGQNSSIKLAAGKSGSVTMSVPVTSDTKCTITARGGGFSKSCTTTLKPFIKL